MENSAGTSIQRAKQLLTADAADDQLVVLKLVPEPPGCCCSHCWPKAWDEVNRHIAPAGPVPHEGDALVEVDGHQVVIESHESGPEFVTWLHLLASSVTVTGFIVGIARYFTRKHRSPQGKTPTQLTLEARRLVRGEPTAEVLMTIELPYPDGFPAMLETVLKEYARRADSLDWAREVHGRASD